MTKKQELEEVWAAELEYPVSQELTGMTLSCNE